MAHGDIYRYRIVECNDGTKTYYRVELRDVLGWYFVGHTSQTREGAEKIVEDLKSYPKEKVVSYH